MGNPIDPNADLKEIEKALKDGELGENLAKRLQKTKNINLTELSQQTEYRIFSFTDEKANYTAMIDKDRLVLLAKTKNGTPPKNFKTTNQTGHKILTFEYQEGQGIPKRKQTTYNLGTKKSLITDNN